MRRRLEVCFALALVVATGGVYAQCDAIACPDGSANATPQRRNTRSSKAQIDVVCERPDGSEVRGSTARVFWSWLGLAIGTFATSWFVWRGLRPLRADERPFPTATALGPPSDRREERRRRKREEHMRRQRGDT